MPRLKIPDDRTWLEKHLRPLMEAGRILEAEDRTLPTRDLPSYDRGPWTGLKLIALKYYLQPYLNILAKRKKVGYVDLFAGPGLNRIGERMVPIPGSPLIPMMIREAAMGRRFSCFFVSEADNKFFAALSARARRFLPEGSQLSRPFHGDANEYVNDLGELMQREGIHHCLAFIDPEGLQWAWTSMRTLVETIDCDVIVNFPSAGLQRLSTRSDSETRRTISRFLGISVGELPDVVDEEWAIQRYRENLAGLGKDISTEIKITDVGSFHYHLIPAVSKTDTGSPWFRVWMELRDRIARLHGRILDMVAQQIGGVMGKLD